MENRKEKLIQDIAELLTRKASTIQVMRILEFIKNYLD